MSHSSRKNVSRHDSYISEHVKPTHILREISFKPSHKKFYPPKSLVCFGDFILKSVFIWMVF